MIKEYLQLKDLPESPAGTVWIRELAYYHANGDTLARPAYTKEYIQSHPDFWEPVEEMEEKLKFKSIEEIGIVRNDHLFKQSRRGEYCADCGDLESKHISLENIHEKIDKLINNQKKLIKLAEKTRRLWKEEIGK